MKMSLQRYAWILLAAISIVGCTGDTHDPVITPTTVIGGLTPYWTAIFTQPIPTMTSVPFIPLTPAPSATPFTHVVVRGETMLGIALRYGVSLDALQAANPSVDPQFLSVDAVLIIPLEDQIQTAAPTPTAVTLPWSQPICYHSGDGGAWCFLLVENNRQAAVENLSAWIGLYDMVGNIVASGAAMGPINILRPGQYMPLTVFFPPPIPNEFVVRGEVLSAVEITRDDDRYLDWQLASVEAVVMGSNGEEARVTGRIERPEGSADPGLIWVVAVAYDADGRVTGFRKWEDDGDLNFELVVYSLGQAIDRVEVLAEIRP